MLMQAILLALAVSDSSSRADRAALFADIVEKTMDRESFSPIKNDRLGLDIHGDMMRERDEFLAADTDEKLFHAILRLSNARKDRHLSVELTPNGLLLDTTVTEAAIRFLPDYSNSADIFLFVSDTERGADGDADLGDRVIAVNDREDFAASIEPYVRYSTVNKFWWELAKIIPERSHLLPRALYRETLDLTLERPSGERYRLSLHSPRNLEQHGEQDGSVLWTVQAMLSEVRSMEERHTQEFVMVKNVSVNGDVETDCRISAHMQILLFGLTNADVAQRVAELETAVATVSADAQIRIDLQRIGKPYMGVVPNQTLTRVVQQTMADMQLDVLTDPEPLPFATDFGNISRRAPSALIGTGRQGGWQFHNLEGDREFQSADGQQVMIVTAEVLARAITAFWEDPGIVVQARTDFEANIGGASP